MSDSSDDGGALLIDLEECGSTEPPFGIPDDVGLRLDPAASDNEHQPMLASDISEGGSPPCRSSSSCGEPLHLDLASSSEGRGRDVQMDNGVDNLVDELLSLASSGASAAKTAMSQSSPSSSPSPSREGELSDDIGLASFQGSDDEEVASQCQGAGARGGNWQSVTVLALEECLTAPLLRRSLFFQKQNIAHTFAGIGSAEIAMGEISTAMKFCLGRSCLWQCQATCELSQSKRQKLVQATPQACHYTDMTDVCKGWVQGKGGDLTFEEKCSLVAKCEFRADGMECEAHGGAHCTFPKVDGEIAGSPCTPWSRIGTRSGRKHHLIHLLIIWCYWLRVRLTPWAIHENVYGFDVNVLVSLLGDLYEIIIIKTNPATCGMLVNRPRLYIVLLLRNVLRAIASIPDTFQFVVQKQRCLPQVDVTSYLIASDEDLLSAENTARRRRGMPPLVVPSVDWQYLLTTKQVQYLKKYSTRWLSERGQSCDGCPNCIFDLSQNPRFRCTQTNHKGKLPTIRSGGLWWMPYKRRWLLPAEAAYLSGVPLEMVKKYDYTWSEIGNAMHIASIGTVLCVCLACIERV